MSWCPRTGHELVPAHKRARKPQHQARALECGGLPPPWSMTNCFKAQASLRIPRRHLASRRHCVASVLLRVFGDVGDAGFSNENPGAFCGKPEAEAIAVVIADASGKPLAVFHHDRNSCLGINERLQIFRFRTGVLGMDKILRQWRLLRVFRMSMSPAPSKVVPSRKSHILVGSGSNRPRWIGNPLAP